MSETKDLQKTVDTILSEMKTITVNDQESYTASAEFLQKVKQSVKFVELQYADDLEAAQNEKRAAEAKRKAIDDEIKKYTSQLTKAEGIVKGLMRDYVNEQERLRRAAEDKRRAEEADKRLDAAIETGREEVLDRPIAVVKEAPVQNVAGSSLTTVWKWKVIDMAKVKPEYVLLDEKSINTLVRSAHKRAEEMVGGIEVWDEKDVRVRA